MKNRILNIVFAVFALNIVLLTGCDTSDLTDEVTSLFNIEFSRDFEITDTETGESFTAHIEFSGDDISYSDSNGYAGTGSLSGTTASANISGPDGVEGTVNITFDQAFDSYSGNINLSDGTNFDFSGNA